MLTDIRHNEDIKRYIDSLIADGKTKLAIVSECMRIFSHLYPDMNNFVAWNNLIQKYIDNREEQNVKNNVSSSSVLKKHTGKQESNFRKYLIKLGYKESRIDSIICNINHFDYNSKGIAGKTSVAFLDICTIEKFNDVVKKKWGSEVNILVSMKPKYSNSLLLYKDFLNSLPNQFDPFAFLKKDLPKEASDTSKQLCAQLAIKKFHNWCQTDCKCTHDSNETNKIIDALSYISSRLFGNENEIFTLNHQTFEDKLEVITKSVNAIYRTIELQKLSNIAINHYRTFLNRVDISTIQNNATKQDSKDSKVVEFYYNQHKFSWRCGDYTALSDLFGTPNSFNEDPLYLFRRRALFIFMKSTTTYQIKKEREYEIPANVKAFKKKYIDKYGTETTRIFIFVCDDNKIAQFYDEVTFIEAKDKSILVKTVLHE